MVWAKAAPPPLLASEPAGPVYYTAGTWGERHTLSRVTAQRHLDKLTKKQGDKPPVLQSKKYRIDGNKTAHVVYWPVGVPGPDEAK